MMGTTNRRQWAGGGSTGNIFGGEEASEERTDGRISRVYIDIASPILVVSASGRGFVFAVVVD